MVYNYKTNKEFIDKSYKLLKKLGKKHLWNKDTLIIGLDKSVRPLAYTLRKLSKEEGRETPDMRFFNYSSYDVSNNNDEETKKQKQILERLNECPNYKNILFLDDSTLLGNSLRSIDALAGKIDFLEKKNLTFASLNSTHPFFPKNMNFIYIKKGKAFNRAKKSDTGIEDKYADLEATNIQESIPIQDKEVYKEFIKNRKKLSQDIKKYVAKKHPRGIKKKNSLEKIAQSFSLLFLIAGTFMGSLKITGNAIGDSNSSAVVSVILIILGIMGLVLSKQVR